MEDRSFFWIMTTVTLQISATQSLGGYKKRTHYVGLAASFTSQQKMWKSMRFALGSLIPVVLPTVPSPSGLGHGGEVAERRTTHRSTP